MLYVLVTAVGADSTLAQIMKVVADAQHRKPQIQAFADRISRVFVPAVIALSILTWVVWAIVAATGQMPGPDHYEGAGEGAHAGHEGGGGHAMGALMVSDPQLLAFMFACAVLVIACPCALGLATPTAVMVGGGVGAAHGILVKGGDVLERAAAVDAVLFDKTGTLTNGKLAVASIAVWAADLAEVRRRLAERAEHPIAKAITAHAAARGVPTVEPVDFVAAAGQGLQCSVDGRAVLLGNRSWMGENGLALDAGQEEWVANLERGGVTVVLAALGDAAGRLELSGAIGVSDTLKDDAPSVVRQLTRQGMQVWMVSGDNERTAAHIAHLAGIHPSRVVAGVKPSGKLSKVQELRHERKRKIAFVGDGVNDAPAHAAADDGNAVGSAPTWRSRRPTSC